VPADLIDQGLTVAPGSIIDQGLLEVPSDFIDQGEIIALANGGRINAMDGGLMNLDSARQMMFIGGIAKAAKKAVKKVTRGVKKIAKSPLGKAALLGAGLYFTRGTGGGILEKFNNLKPFQKALFGIGATSALAGLTTPKEEDEEIDLEEYYKQAMINPNAPLSRRILGTEFAANGGRIGYAEGSKEPVAKKVMPLFTADAVRNAGGGDVDKGSEVMYNMMKNLEAGGEISEESQGLEGAREMFQTSQRLGEVI